MKPFLTPRDVATELHVIPDTVLKWIRGGKLKATRVGGRWRIDRADLDEFLKQEERPRSTERTETS